MNHKGLNQLLCAAIVNNRFREMLLRNPAQAIATGYLDQGFSLTPEERDLVIGIHAHQLEDFAAQVYGWISGNGNGTGYYADVYSDNVYRDNGHNEQKGRGTNGHKHNLLITGKPFVDLVRVPVLA